MSEIRLSARDRRTILLQLSRDRLGELTTRFELEVEDRRSIDAHVDAIVRKRTLDFTVVLNVLKREELQAACEALGLDSSGREKAVLVERILERATNGATDDAGAGEAPFSLEAPEEKAATTKKKSTAQPAGRAKSGQVADSAQVLSYRYADRRKNNPEVGMVDPETDPGQPKTQWAYDPHIDPALQFDVGRSQVEKLIDDALGSGDEAVMRRALEQLKRQAEPYLNWTGKAERTSFEIDTVSLHVHERIDPASILNAVRKRPKGEKAAQPKMQLGLFSAPFENLPLRDAIDFYKHDKGWSNRLVAGDSLLVMNSLLQKEAMAGQVQMIYLDPPYGIRYGSNFQPFTNKRDVQDRKDQDLTQEPEMLKAFRDTWELGIHSYLTYLRDRALLASQLLSASGSLFVQISDENVHLVRNLLDDVFGAENFVAQIVVQKTGGLGTTGIKSVADYLIWYAKSKDQLKYHQLYHQKLAGVGEGSGGRYDQLASESGDVRRSLTKAERRDPSTIPAGWRPFQLTALISAAFRENTTVNYNFRGEPFHPGENSCWKTTNAGLDKLSAARRIEKAGKTIRYVRFLRDFPAYEVTNVWDDVAGAPDKVYVVQTSAAVIERCMLMTTDPGDLVLDPTCGSGTTAFVAEKWGRRWITCDTSRVAVTLAKQRLMTSSFDYYELKYPHEGLKGGFIYKTVPHVTLKSIANNPEIDEIYERLHPAVTKALDELNAALRTTPPSPFGVGAGGRVGKTVDFRVALGKAVDLPSGENAPSGALLDWEVPVEFPSDWPTSARTAFDTFHQARQRMQRKMEESIDVHAEQEVLYDDPQPSNDKLRITGPFTVEAVPFPSVLSLDEARPPEEADVAIARSGETSRQHQWRDELLRTGIRGKGGQLMKFAALETLPGTRYLHTSGTLADTGERVVVSFGPEHGALEQRPVEMAMREAGELFPRPKMIVFAAFAFDPEAAKDIDQTKGIVALKAQMNTDLLTEDLKKARSSNQSFWLMGQPDIDVRKRKDGLYEVEVNGFDYFDTTKGELVSGGKGKIAVWLLDTDYDERSLFPRQVFFPMAGAKDGWHKLRKDIRAELDETLLSEFHGTVSLPFEAGENRKVAVKVVDDRGIESLKVIRLD
jgi:adenine-specific DNA-methyltransferase